MLDIQFRVRQKDLYMQKIKVIALVKLRVNNEKAKQRTLFHAFS